MRMKYFTAVAIAFGIAAYSGAAGAAEMDHGSMSGMKMEGHGDMKAGGHGKMGEKVFGGKVGSWQGEARLIDMKASIEKAKASGMKMEGTMKSHHIALTVTDPKTKKSVTEGKGSVTVTGPDGKPEKTDLTAMSGHFGADVDLPKPGKYTFKVSVESGKKTGSATFAHTVK